MPTEMTAFVLHHEPLIRLGCFLGVLTIMAVWEVAMPRRTLTVPKARRWISNLGLALCSSLVLRLLFPASAVGVAIFAQSRGWGFLNHSGLPQGLAVPLAILLLDLIVYLQHVMFHAVPVLWRLHQVHHADLNFDVTTGVRFHPLEIVLSMLLKCVVIVILGAPPLAVLGFEVLLNATAMFNHGNVRMPLALDGLIRNILVTPDMHRVHHSTRAVETNSNYGFNLPWWDKLFGTYRAQPEAGQAGMTIGLDDLRDPGQVDRLKGMLALPFKPRTPNVGRRF